jgi:hypothetical protein
MRASDRKHSIGIPRKICQENVQTCSLTIEAMRHRSGWNGYLKHNNRNARREMRGHYETESQIERYQCHAEDRTEVLSVLNLHVLVN